MKVHIFTDGACSGNPGKGGFGVLLRVVGTPHEKQISAGFRNTTNNRMELLAVIIGLEQLKTNELKVEIFTDSRYVSDAFNKSWIHGWVKKGFAKVKNPDLWKRLYVLYRKFNPTFHWIRGHAGHPENELVDRLAVAASKGEKLLIDQYFEQENQKNTLF